MAETKISRDTRRVTSPRRKDDWLTAEFARSLFRYDPDTGLFSWNVDYSGTVFVGRGTIIRTKSHGYVILSIKNKKYRAHRIAWLIHYGYIPQMVIDHKNGLRDDNRISNLRLADRSQNSMSGPLRKDNSSGVRGVHLHKASGKWRVQIHAYGSVRQIGMFSSLEEAALARRAAEIEYHGAFASHRRMPRQFALQQHASAGDGSLVTPSVPVPSSWAG